MDEVSFYTACAVLSFLFYVFTCILAHKLFYHVCHWRNEADMLACFWPAILLFFLLFGWPFMAMVWTVNKSPKFVMRLVKKAKRSYCEVK